MDKFAHPFNYPQSKLKSSTISTSKPCPAYSTIYLNTSYKSYFRFPDPVRIPFLNYTQFPLLTSPIYSQLSPPSNPLSPPPQLLHHFTNFFLFPTTLLLSRPSYQLLPTLQFTLQPLPTTQPNTSTLHLCFRTLLFICRPCTKSRGKKQREVPRLFVQGRPA